MPLVRQADVDNHNMDGGLWVVAGGHVYDIDHLRAEFSQQQVERCIRKSRHVDWLRCSLRLVAVRNFAVRPGKGDR